MISEEDFDVAAEPSVEMAFIRLERKFRTTYEVNLRDSDGNGAYYHYTSEYMNHVVAAADAFGIELFDFGYSRPKQNTIFDDYQAFRQILDRYIVRHTISHIRSGLKNSVVLSTAEKGKLRHYVAQIKEVIDNADLVPGKKERLYDLINAFLAELDRDRTGLQRFGDLMIGLAHIGGEMAKEMEPAWKWAKLIGQVLGARVDAEQNRLPPPPKKIEPPKQRKIEPPKKPATIDDDIPF
jgi:hypothetical protein